MNNIPKLRHFVQAMTALVEEARGDEKTILAKGKVLLADLVAKDDWLPEAFATPDPSRYQQFLLHCDPLERFSMVSFVWGPGQRTPVHNHTVWGLVGMLRGRETSYQMVPQGAGKPMQVGQVDKLSPGEVVAVSPNLYDIHYVQNDFADRTSISIHVYGGNIGAIRRSVFNPDTGGESLFISGYTNTQVPNLWDRSQESAAA